MWRYIFLCSFLANYAVVFGFFDKIISKGRWLVESVEKCPNADQYPWDFIIGKKKLNRTHDGFYGQIDLPCEFNEEDYGIHIEAFKKVDGGFKLMQVFKDKSFCKFIMKHAEANFKRGLILGGLEPKCPVPKGLIKIDNYPFDYSEMPEDGMIGEFKSSVYITKGLEYLTCFILYVSFKNKEDAD